VILDRFVIGAQLGARSVTFYTVPFQLAERTNVIPVALSSAMFPRLAQTGLGEGGKALADKALRSLAIIITPLFLIGIFSIDWFLSFWIGEEFASQASFVGQILLLGFWWNAIARIPHALLQAAGRPDVVAKSHLAELIPYLLLLYVGLGYLGISGAAIAFSIRALADSVILMYWAKVLKSSLRFLCTPALLMVVTVVAARPDRPLWILVSMGAGMLSVCLYWALVNMPEELVRLLRKYTPKH